MKLLSYRIIVALCLSYLLVMSGCAPTRPLVISAGMGDLEETKRALNKGADVDAMGKYGSTALQDASFSGYADIVRLLLDNDADVRLKGRGGLDALHFAARGGHRDIMQLLIDNGAEVNSDTENGNTALHFAAENGHEHLLQPLLDSGAEINGSDLQGQTALHKAAVSGVPGVVIALIEAGADIDVEDSATNTPISLAQKHNNSQVALILSNEHLVQGIALKQDSLTQKEEPPIVTATNQPLTNNKPVETTLDTGPYHALVIGNNDYQYLPKLRTATHDARSVAKLLSTKYGFDVTLLLDAKRSDILLAVNAYRRSLTATDNLLIYYAGHGWLDKDADQGYWLPVDATRDNQIMWVSNSAITSEIRAIRAKHIMVVADSCYSGKITRGLYINNRTADYLTRMSEKRARVVLSSGGLEPVLDSGGKDNHSVFASAFMDALNENSTVLDGTTLFTKVREKVGWNADQIPEYAIIHKAGHDGGDFLFTSKQ